MGVPGCVEGGGSIFVEKRVHKDVFTLEDKFFEGEDIKGDKEW